MRKAAKKGMERRYSVLSFMNSLKRFQKPNLSPQRSLQQEVKGWITSNNIGFGKVMQPLAPVT
jgi:hypothetical protein